MGVVAAVTDVAPGRPAMLDGRPLIDAHQHPVRLPTVKPAWLDWAERYGQPGWREAYTGDGAIIPQAFDDLMRGRPRDERVPGPRQRATKP